MILPYPVGLVSEMRLADGSKVTLRPIRPEDARIEVEFVAGLTEQSRRMRFLSGLKALSPAMLARFTQIDYDREMALIATRDDAGHEREIAVCRYFTLPDGETCEFALAVGDAWQRRGLGRRMMAKLITIARERGLKTMVGDVAASNDAMLRLCADLGFAAASREDDPQLHRVTLALAAR